MNHPEYLVSFGLSGDIGRFRAAAPLSLPRGARVLIRTKRGVEVGAVVRPAGGRHARLFPGAEAGELLRPAGPADEAVRQRQRDRAAALLERGGVLIDEMSLPVTLLDAEVLFDGRTAAVQHVRWGECDVRELVRPLSREFELAIVLTDVGTHPQHEHGGCGEGGCGEGGCGSCGEGGCGSSCGSAIGADAVQAYFAELREKMERRVSLL
jgi:cell fate regulator YaaT (PSP1 superfamily)